MWGRVSGGDRLRQPCRPHASLTFDFVADGGTVAAIPSRPLCECASIATNTTSVGTTFPMDRKHGMPKIFCSTTNVFSVLMSDCTDSFWQRRWFDQSPESVHWPCFRVENNIKTSCEFLRRGRTKNDNVTMIMPIST